MLSSLPVFLPVLCALRLLRFVLYSWPPFCFLFSGPTKLIDTYITVPIHVRITLRTCLNSFSICIFISLIPAYVCLNMHTHFPSLPYSYTIIAIFVCMLCVVFSTYTLFLFPFFFIYKLNRPPCHGAYWCTHNPAHMCILFFHLHLHFFKSIILTYTCMHIRKTK